MAEHEGSVPRDQGGISRRDLVRRGAVVGGTLLWAAPVIQSLGPAAYAHTVGSPVFGCCECTSCPTPSTRRCTSNGCFTQVECNNFCAQNNCTGPSTTHCGPNPITCNPPGAPGQCGTHP